MNEKSEKGRIALHKEDQNRDLQPLFPLLSMGRNEDDIPTFSTGKINSVCGKKTRNPILDKFWSI